VKNSIQPVIMQFLNNGQWMPYRTLTAGTIVNVALGKAPALAKGKKYQKTSYRFAGQGTDQAQNGYIPWISNTVIL